MDPQELDLRPLSNSDSSSEQLDFQPLDLRPIPTPAQPKLPVQAVQDKPAEAKPNPTPASPSFMDSVSSYIPQGVKDVWHATEKPLTDLPTRIGKSMSDYLDPTQYGTSDPRRYLSAYPEAFGSALSGATSPQSLALMGLSGGAGAIAKQAPNLARVARLGVGALSVPMATSGAQTALDSSRPWDERLGGAVQGVLGGLGMREGVGAIRPQLRAGFTPEAQSPSTPEEVNASMVEARQRADQIVKKVGSEPLLEPMQIITGIRQYNELMAKAENGTITQEEITQGLQLERKLREVNFGETGTPNAPAKQQPPEMQLNYQEPNPQYPGNVRVSEAPPEQTQQLPQSWQQFTPDRLREMGVTPAEPEELDLQPIEPTESQTQAPQEQAVATLPKELQGAKPRFNMGGDSYEPQFESDLDKALYIIAGKGRSKSHAGYLQFAMDTLGVDESTAVGLGHQVKKAVKAQILNEEPGVVRIPDTKIGAGLRGGNEPPGANVGTPSSAGAGPPEPPHTANSDEGEPPTPEDIPKRRPDKSGPLQSLWDLPRGLMSVDLPFITSAGFRQGTGYIGTGRWFQAWANSARAYGSKATEALVDAKTKADPIFQPTEEPVLDKNGKPVIDKETGQPKTKKKEPWADRMGLRTGDLAKYSTRDESIRGELAEHIPIYGRHVAANNRAFNTWVNTVSRATFKQEVYQAAKLAKTPEENPFTNDVLGKQMAEAVNTTLKRGRLGFEVGPYEVNMEKNSRLLGNVFFSARNIASEVRMLNLGTYVMSPPAVRRIYLTAVARRVAAWTAMATLAKAAGATVVLDPTNSDFGKIKIGNTRIDPPGGLSQFIVLAGRMLAGGSTSSNTTTNKGTGKFTPFGVGYKSETRTSTALQFGLNRLHPSAGYAIDLGSATRKEPVGLADRTLQLATPMFLDDLADVSKRNPELAPAVAILSSAGMGAQSYDRKSFKASKFIPLRNDIVIGRHRY